VPQGFGAGHATNLIVRPATLTWLAGESLVRRHKVLEAERFATCFCAECGSPLPRLIPEMDMVVVPAGSLDDDPGIRPQAHIFWGSRAEWSCSDGGLPVFAEYPPGVVAPKWRRRHTRREAFLWAPGLRARPLPTSGHVLPGLDWARPSASRCPHAAPRHGAFL
jgi:hypothetical protein